ncbi:MAG: POTRA domain-containing protein, partial [Bacteriovoracaceae bacterium]
MRLACFLAIFAASVFAAPMREKPPRGKSLAENPFQVRQVKVDCLGKGECEFIEDTLRSLKRKYVDLDHLKQTIELYALNEGILSFEYALAQSKEDFALNIDLKMKRPLLDYSIKVKNDPGIELPTVVPLREGDYIDDKSLLKTKVLLQEVSQSQGYPDAVVRFKQREKDKGVELEVVVEPGRPILVEKAHVSSDSDFLLSVTKRVASRFLKKAFFLQDVKNTLEELRQLFIDYGYYLNDISLNYHLDSPYSATLEIAIKNNELHAFYPDGNKFLEQDEIKTALKNTVLSFKRKLSTDAVIQTTAALYAEKGFINTKISVDYKRYEDVNGEDVNHYHIFIKENERTRISKILFNGNSSLSGKKLRKAFYASAPEVVKSGFFQRKYVENFGEIIRREYVVRGYVNVLVEEPRINFVDGQAFVSYRLREGVKAVAGKVQIKGVPQKLADTLKGFVNVKENKFFNPASFKRDLEMIENRLRQEGYFYAQIKNKNSGNIVQYRNDNSTVDIN